MNNFLVYKSSAGSGKTTILVKEYLKLTLKNPALFKSILAITFTNKAANEMKTRILEYLKEIIAGNTHNDIINSILQETNLPNKQIILNAKRLLFFIDHHYDEFSVSTIDSFVHKIIRTFAGDMGLPQTFEVIIEKEDFVPFILEDIYKKVGTDKVFSKILTDYVLTQVEDEKNYNISSSLSDFIENQLKEEYFFDSLALENIQTSDFFAIITRLQSAKFKLKNDIIKLGTRALDLIAENKLQFTDFLYKKNNGAISYFIKAKEFYDIEKLSNPLARSIDIFENNKGWYAKNSEENIALKIENIIPQLKLFYKEIKIISKTYLLRSVIFKNIYQVALIHEIRSLFKTFIEQTQKVHISEFNKRIATEIAGQPVPYIYERLGNRYTHFMLDEFQDTSILQWNNLLPLLEESLANNHFNMIVGDAKQAIYRFRGGEVELFTDLPKLYGIENIPEKKLREQVLIQNFISKPLTINYRSRSNIINFNNNFFEVAKDELSNKLKTIYYNHKQQTPKIEKTGGFVSFSFINAPNANDFRTKKVLKIENIITDLHKKGYDWKKIAVLCRGNNDATTVATYLLQKNIPVISSESVKLISSVRIRFLISFLYYIVNPYDKINLANLTLLFLKLKNKQEKFHAIFFEKKFSFKQLLKSNGIENINLNQFSRLTVYEICEELVLHFFGHEPIDIFTRFFLDFVVDKQTVHLGDVGRFLELWQNKNNKLNINIPENINAVQIMTAHKAKGLKFDVVIVDLENFKTNNNTKKQFWDAPGIEETKPLDTTLFDINKTLEAINRKDIYEKEIAKSKLDELNLIYVAFTRAVDALYAIGYINEKGKPGNFGKYLVKYLKSNNLFDNMELTYSFGILPVHDEKTIENKSNGKLLSFMPTNLWQSHLQIAGIEQKTVFSKKSFNKRAYGTLLHNILTEIKTSNDILKVLNIFEHNGIINAEIREFLLPVLTAVVSHNKLAPYFADNVFVKTEMELYDIENDKIIRPDRVVFKNNNVTVLDYKTGEKEEKHKKQIRQYGQIIAKTGYNIEKLILVYIGKQIEVVTEMNF